MKSSYYLYLICFLPTLVSTKTTVFFGNSTEQNKITDPIYKTAGMLLRLNTVEKTDGNTRSLVSRDSIIRPGTTRAVLEIDRGVGASEAPSSFEILFSPQNKKAMEKLETATSLDRFDPGDYMWISLVRVDQWSKHGPFQGTLYYGANDEKRSEGRLDKKIDITAGKTVYTFRLIGDRIDRPGTQNDDLEFYIYLEDIGPKPVSAPKADPSKPAAPTPPSADTMASPAMPTKIPEPTNP